MYQIEQDYYAAAINFFNKKNKMEEELAALKTRVTELEYFKAKIEKLPNYTEWIAGYNCGGYHD